MEKIEKYFKIYLISEVCCLGFIILLGIVQKIFLLFGFVFIGSPIILVGLISSVLWFWECHKKNRDAVLGRIGLFGNLFILFLIIAYVFSILSEGITFLM